jgi:hypothetical protein
VKVRAIGRPDVNPAGLYFNVACLLATLLFWANFLAVSRTVVWAPLVGPFPTNALCCDWAPKLQYHDVYASPLAALRLIFSFDKMSPLGNPEFPVSPFCFVRSVTDPVTFVKIYLLATSRSAPSGSACSSGCSTGHTPRCTPWPSPS